MANSAIVKIPSIDKTPFIPVIPTGVIRRISQMAISPYVRTEVIATESIPVISTTTITLKRQRQRTSRNNGHPSAKVNRMSSYEVEHVWSFLQPVTMATMMKMMMMDCPTNTTITIALSTMTTFTIAFVSIEPVCVLSASCAAVTV